MEAVTVKDFDILLEEILAKENAIEVQGEILKSLNKELMLLNSKATAYLKELGRDKYESPKGTCKIVQVWRVGMPADDFAKKELFEHLREREIFDKYATVNSNSLNALYMADWREAQARGEGMTFSMPGVPAPTLFEKFDFKQAKVKKVKDE